VLIIFLGGGIGVKTNYPKMNGGNPIVFGHRGGVNNQFVENSFAAFNKGISLGFNGIETDIRLTKDKKIVLFHDESCLRLLGIDRSINELNWEDIASKTLVFNNKKTLGKVLLLEDLIKKIPDSIIIYIDVKVSSFELADHLLALIDKTNHLDRLIVADEDIVFLCYLKYKNPNVNVALEGYNKGKEWTHYIIPKNFKPDYYSSHISEVDSNHVVFLKKNNLLLNRIVYGVQQGNVSDVLELGIPNVIYDYDVLGKEINELKKALFSNALIE
jgi:glycerophosphoryl diester phosphodiesterase